MFLHRLDEAKGSLQEGLKLVEMKLESLSENGDLGRDFDNWLIAQIMMREASALIGDKKEP